MMKKFLPIALCLAAVSVFAGNADRRGEAGAYELIMNGWARSTGMWGMGSARVWGLEAERINPAGVARVQGTEIAAAYSLWMQGSGIGVVHGGIAQSVGKNVFALNIQSLNFGTNYRTTYDNPEGAGLGTFSPRFLNLGLTYGRNFGRGIYGGVTIRFLNQGLENISASGFSVDAGLQYTTGKKENFHLGVALRNLGTPLRFSGDGFSFQGTAAAGDYQLTFANKTAKFELPVQLNVGLAYDILMGTEYLIAAKKTQPFRLTVAANFTSNAFGKDNFGAGLEFAFKEMFMLRGGYRYENGITSSTDRTTAFTGFSAGMGVDIPFKKDRTGSRLGIDYSFRSTSPYKGTHSIGLRFNIAAKEKIKDPVSNVASALVEETKKDKKSGGKKSKAELAAESLARIDSINLENEKLRAELEAAKSKAPDTVVRIKNVEIVKVDTFFFGSKSHIEEKDGKKVEVMDDYDNLEFESGAAIISKSSYEYLDFLVTKLRKNKDGLVKLQGHTDNVGPREKNLKLSQERVLAVKQYFISKGIEDYRIGTEAFGPDKPKVPNDNAANRQKNRRVEIFIEY
jgi:outer membrane protein OmpA-like peptidoglycan-associated protein